MADNLVKEIRDIRRISRISINASRKNYNKKKKMLAKGKCEYCKGNFTERMLTITKKNLNSKNGEYSQNKVVVCKRCNEDKNRLGLDHDEFIKYLYNERRKKRDDFNKKYPKIAEKVFKKYKYQCIYCNYEYGYTPKNRRLTIDHKKSLYRRGDNNFENLCSACVEHNKDKGPLTAEQYFKILEKRKKTKNKARI